jgi:hypothetical protein
VHTFHGGGPTGALFARQPLGETGFALYGSARGSVMVGKGRENFVASQNITDTGIVMGLNLTSHLTDRFASGREDTIPIVEVEAGVEYGLDIVGVRLIGQAGVVGQTYIGAGSASSENGNLSLFGFTAAIGVVR